MKPTHCLELAVVTVKDAARMDSIQMGVHHTAATYPGYLQSIALRSIKDPTLRADVVLWSSEKEAKAAAKMFESDDRMKACMAEIEEVRYFSHFVPQHQADLAGFADSAIV